MLKFKLQYFGDLMWRVYSLKKTLLLEKLKAKGKGGGRGWHGWWHYPLNGHEFEQTPGDGKGHGSLACCSPWGHEESNMAWWLNNNEKLGQSLSTDAMTMSPIRFWTPNAEALLELRSFKWRLWFHHLLDAHSDLTSLPDWSYCLCHSHPFDHCHGSRGGKGRLQAQLYTVVV